MEKAICIVPLPLMDTVDNVHWICSQETGPLQWSIIGSGMPSALGLILQYFDGAKAFSWKGHRMFTRCVCQHYARQKECRRLHSGEKRVWWGFLRKRFLAPFEFLIFSASEIKTVLSCLILCRRTFPCFQSLAGPTTLLFVPRGLTGDKVRRSRVWGKETKSTVFRCICKTMKYISVWFWFVHF